MLVTNLEDRKVLRRRIIM